ncbi:hypothetical protein K438DRAFT_1998163 [Mycena galopus ATCC 62051]|nr:hypothetical protein K438DRAFT_1998163 [Mycena galopus ATCC 62051]
MACPGNRALVARRDNFDHYGDFKSTSWEPDADGFRGHILVSDNNSTVVTCVKTSSGPGLAGDKGSHEGKGQPERQPALLVLHTRPADVVYCCDCYASGQRQFILSNWYCKGNLSSARERRN